MRGRSVFLYVQHLLGIGHLKRALVIARALAAAGFRVTVASGGQDVPLLNRTGLNWLQLPPATISELAFGKLLDARGQPVDEHWKAERTAMLLKAWQESQADVLLIELFPFGRRQMRFELLPLLEAAKAATRRPLIVSSIRDVLGGAQGDTQRQLKMLTLFDRYFDRLLVHGDESLIPLQMTFGPTPNLGARLSYTGYVVDSLGAATKSTEVGRGEVLVSAGGGAVGLPLLATAILARPLSSLSQRRWRVLAGSNVTELQFRSLQELAAETGQGRVLVERARPDFVAMLVNCAVSVSQGGYNTVLEVLSQGARSVIVPFSAGGETEQSLRSSLLAKLGWIQCLGEEQLSAQSLAAAVDQAAGTPPRRSRVDLDGARKTVELLSSWLSPAAD